MTTQPLNPGMIARLNAAMDEAAERASREPRFTPVQPLPPVTLGERLMPGCRCGAAATGSFDRCRCD